MRNLTMFVGVLFLMGSAACAQKNDKRGKGGAEMTTQMDSISYIFGSSLGQNIRQAEIGDVNEDQVMQGFRDAMESDSTMKITMQEGNVIVRNYMQAKATVDVEKKMSELADDSYTKTESGMYYKVLEPGDGAMPAATDKVKVNYEGKTTDGEVFDSSYERGTPAEFPLNRVIPGWTEVLQLMNTGSTIEVVIPPALAYGERGSPPNIGPNEVLIFKIELIEILPAE